MSCAPSVAERLHGPIVPLNICFTASGEVDFAAMGRYADWLCAQGVPVLLLTYGSSEYAWLSDEDIYRLTADIAEAVAGRSCFVTSSSFWPAKVCAGFLRHAEGVGADAVKVQINMWGMGGAGAQKPALLRTYFDEAGAGSAIPLLLWCNSAGGEPLPVDLVAEMAARDRVVGLKNDDHPFYYYYDLCRATQDEDFAVWSGGQMRNFVLGHQLGSAGYLCTTAPFRPDVALQFYNTLTSGDTAGAWETVARYEDPWLSAASEIGWLRAIKTALFLHGLVPSDRVGGTWAEGTSNEREAVGRTLERVFGRIENVGL
jgi:4-hydroxy-tetrahydrodipicolinate synthase